MLLVSMVRLQVALTSLLRATVEQLDLEAVIPLAHRTRSVGILRTLRGYFPPIFPTLAQYP